MFGGWTNSGCGYDAMSGAEPILTLPLPCVDKVIAQCCVSPHNNYLWHLKEMKCERVLMLVENTPAWESSGHRNLACEISRSHDSVAED
jgi:hypothetical protein